MTHPKTIRSFCIILALVTLGHESSAQVKQSRDVLEAYAVCNRFQQILSKDLNFSDAFEATFATDIKRRREIALRDGELGPADLSDVDTTTLVNAYKNRMQLVYLMLPLAGPTDYEEEALFFPPEINAIFKRPVPESSTEFPAYASQLENDVLKFRTHLNDLAAKNPRVAARLTQFKHEVLAGKLMPPKTRRVRSGTGSYSGHAVWDGEPYYEFDGYTVVREGKQMKIVSIRFFTRLF